jgi:hypothetical protein
MFGLERNQQAEDKDERHRTVFRVLKDRYTGQATGETFVLEYDSDTGLLTEGLFQHEDERSNYESTFGGDAPRF